MRVVPSIPAFAKASAGYPPYYSLATYAVAGSAHPSTGKPVVFYEGG